MEIRENVAQELKKLSLSMVSTVGSNMVNSPALKQVLFRRRET
jgi:hypothetical protein